MKTPKPNRRILAALVFLGAAALVTTGIVSARAQSDKRESREIPRAVVGTHELMDLFSKPLYEHLRAAMEKSPADDQQWKTIADRGWQVAEVANLIAMREDQRQWREMASQLQQAGIELNNAARAEDAGATQDAYRAVIQRCNACHQAMKPGHAPQLAP